jgi:tetratricopeptide (TPR) repeat protein
VDREATDSELDAARGLIERADALLEDGRSAEALALYGETVVRFAGSTELPVRVEAATALVRTSYVLVSSGRFDAAVDVADSAVAHFGDDPSAPVAECVTNALLNKGMALRELGQGDEALRVYADAARRLDGRPEPELRENVAHALCDRAWTLVQLGREEDAVRAYAEVEIRFADATEDALSELWAEALVQRATLLCRLDRCEEAVAVADELTARLGFDERPEIRASVAWGLAGKVCALRELGRTDEALACCDQLLVRYGAPTDADRLQDVLGWVLYERATALRDAGRTADAVAAYDALIARFADSDEPEVRAYVGWALWGKGVLLDEDGGAGEELGQIADQLIARRDETVDAQLCDVVAWALRLKAGRLSESGRAEEALDVHDELIRRFGESDEQALRERVGWALRDKAVLLQSLDRGDELPPVLDALASLDASDPDLRENIAWALQLKAARLAAEARHVDEVEVLDELVRRFERDDALGLRVRTAVALVTRARACRALGQVDGELAGYDGVVSRFADAPERELRQLVADARRRQGIRLDELGRTQAALAAFDEALAIADGSTDVLLVQERLRALLAKGLTLAADSDEALVVFESVSSIYRAERAEGREPTTEMLESVVLSQLYRVGALARHGRADAAGRLVEELAGLLDGGPPPSVPDSAPPLGERDLAGLFVATHAGEAWMLLATGGDTEESRRLLAGKAVELYQATSSWLESDLADWDRPPVVAAMILRHIADGYAMLARDATPETRAQLPMPNRPLTELMVGLAGIDSWTAEHGVVLDLRESAEAAEELVEANRRAHDASDWSESLPQRVTAGLWEYELLTLLLASPAGREALTAGRVQAYAAWRIGEARRWVAWTWQYLEETSSAAVALLLIAQAWFLASRGVAGEHVPSRELLAELVAAADL